MDHNLKYLRQYANFEYFSPSLKSLTNSFVKTSLKRYWSSIIITNYSSFLIIISGVIEDLSQLLYTEIARPWEGTFLSSTCIVSAYIIIVYHIALQVVSVFNFTKYHYYSTRFLWSIKSKFVEITCQWQARRIVYIQFSITQLFKQYLKKVFLPVILQLHLKWSINWFLSTYFTLDIEN